MENYIMNIDAARNAQENQDGLEAETANKFNFPMETQIETQIETHVVHAQQTS